MISHNQMPQQQTPQIMFDFVQGEMAAYNYLVAPGNTVYLLDSINKVLYEKNYQAMRVYDLTERELPKNQNGSDNYSGMPMTPYYNDNYGRRMRSSTTGRYMNGPNSGQTIYGHSIPDRMVAQLEDMMDQANNEYERQMIQNEIANIRKNSNMT